MGGGGRRGDAGRGGEDGRGWGGRGWWGGEVGGRGGVSEGRARDAHPSYEEAPSSARVLPYRGTSRIRNNPPLGPYSSPMPRALRWSQEEGSYARDPPVWVGNSVGNCVSGKYRDRCMQHSCSRHAAWDPHSTCRLTSEGTHFWYRDRPRGVACDREIQG